ncbi:hypothetical protein [Gordonia hydrophobica]|uniref:Uncharacterized protein n=1 Tax=Gordonia hydrophobica TaxID=40516 RepID=A0ABZ2TYU2_9ACTN|nr:hypothetical protein [Gordonia hydrophobica]MBM7367189.1 hypothetical protein [Gordonia hydrophobica]
MTESTSYESAAELRFFLPSGPPLPPKRWQRRWKVGIRIGSIAVAAVFAILAVGAVVFGAISASTFTASGAVDVNCSTRAAPSAPDIRQGASVTILDASTGDVYGTTTLTDFTALKSGICLLRFEVHDVPVASLYTVRIGSTFEELASADALRGGAVIS